MTCGFATHEVTNQPPPLEGLNLYATDCVLVEAVRREAGGAGEERLACFGAWLGAAETQTLGDQANRWPPGLKSHDRFGRRLDEVEFHPAWHALLGRGVAERIHALPWAEPGNGAHVIRAALAFLLNQVEAGVCCPLAMTFAALPALADAPALAARWTPKLLSATYDPALRPIEAKPGALIGMAMTEKQGGSDVRANRSEAEPTGDGLFRLVGHKCFCSAPMSDAFLTLARTREGLSCFLLPRVLPDGRRNAFHLQRLKEKLGNRSNASGEVEYAGAFAHLVGTEGEGVRTIIKMVHHTRLDAAISAAGLMRQALAQALHHAAHRQVFGKTLIDQPLMRNVLADLALEVEVATSLVMRLAGAFDRARDDQAELAFSRLATAIAKYWICKQCPRVVVEALECLGGNGYVEESILPRLYREAPVNSVWEGSGNVICLDVLRAIERQPEALNAVLAEIRKGAAGEPRLSGCLDRLQAMLARKTDLETEGRRLVELLALGLSASLLVRHAPAPVADAFLASRLASDEGGRQFGTLRAGLDVAPIIERARAV
jgi:putative acyl-CoA dehydrogenase